MEQEMATHSSTIAWRIPWKEEPGGYSPWGHQESDTTEHAHTFTFTFFLFNYLKAEASLASMQWKKKKAKGPLFPKTINIVVLIVQRMEKKQEVQFLRL